MACNSSRLKLMRPGFEGRAMGGIGSLEDMRVGAMANIMEKGSNLNRKRLERRDTGSRRRVLVESIDVYGSGNRRTSGMGSPMDVAMGKKKLEGGELSDTVESGEKGMAKKVFYEWMRWILEVRKEEAVERVSVGREN